MSEHAWKAFEVSVADHIAEVALTGPGKGNAMGPDFWSELPQLFGQLDADDDVRAVILTGSGRHFSYGLDLVAMGGTLSSVLADGAKARPRTEFLDSLRGLQNAITAVADATADGTRVWLSDGRHTEVSGDGLTPGMAVITDQRAAGAKP